MQDEISKIKEQIATLKEVDPDSPKVATLQKKLDALVAKSGAVAPGDDAFELGMDEEEFADVKTGFSNRPVAGEYVAIIGTVDRDYSEKSMKVPYTIIEEGPWKGFDQDALYPSKSKEALFSIKNICSSAGVKPMENPKTKKLFYPLTQIEGKKVMAVYKDETGVFVGNDGIERQVTRAKVKHFKPFYEKPTTIL